METIKLFRPWIRELIFSSLLPFNGVIDETFVLLNANFFLNLFRSTLSKTNFLVYWILFMKYCRFCHYNVHFSCCRACFWFDKLTINSQSLPRRQQRFNKFSATIHSQFTFNEQLLLDASSFFELLFTSHSLLARFIFFAVNKFNFRKFTCIRWLLMPVLINSCYNVHRYPYVIDFLIAKKQIHKPISFNVHKK